MWGNKIVIYGGKGENNTTLRDLWSFDLDSRTWCRVWVIWLIITISYVTNSCYHQCRIMTVFVLEIPFLFLEILEVYHYLTSMVVIMYRIMEEEWCLCHFCFLDRFSIRFVDWLIDWLID